MRISVCEFLRVVTGENWFYLKPGHWVNSDHSKEAVREDDHIFNVYKGNKIVEVLEYFEGKTSYQVRMEAMGRKKRR